MNTKFILTGVLVFLVVVIIVLALVLIKPPSHARLMDFEYLMELTQEKRSSLKWINITYGVNLTLGFKNISGEMNFYRNKTNKVITFSSKLKDYEGYGIMLPPERLIRFINTSRRREYSGHLGNRNETCWSTITEPEGDYRKFIDGKYLFITCFNKETGYPELVYASELNKGKTVYSKFFIKSITYS